MSKNVSDGTKDPKSEYQRLPKLGRSAEILAEDEALAESAEGVRHDGFVGRTKVRLRPIPHSAASVKPLANGRHHAVDSQY